MRRRGEPITTVGTATATIPGTATVMTRGSTAQDCRFHSDLVTPIIQTITAPGVIMATATLTMVITGARFLITADTPMDTDTAVDITAEE